MSRGLNVNFILNYRMRRKPPKDPAKKRVKIRLGEIHAYKNPRTVSFRTEGFLLFWKYLLLHACKAGAKDNE